MKTAIFGGTFDPFTVAHEAIIKKLIEDKIVDSVFIAPTITNWYRDTVDKWLTDEERVDICIAAANKINSDIHDSGAARIWFNDVIKKNIISEGELRDEFVKNWHFIDTLIDFRTYLNVTPTDEEVLIVIGSDQLEFFKNWYCWQDILKMAKLIVVNNRNGKHVESDIPHIDITIDEKYNNVSATEIRRKYSVMPGGYAQYKKTFKIPEKEIAIAHTPIFDLVKKPAPYDDKPEFRPFAIKSPDWVMMIVEKDGKFLTVEQLRYGIDKNMVEFPCGMIEENEPAIEAGIRELQEETGIQVKIEDVEYIGSSYANPAFMTNKMNYFYVNLNTAKYVESAQNLDEHERLNVAWLDKNTFIDKVDNINVEQQSVFTAAAIHFYNNNNR